MIILFITIVAHKQIQAVPMHGATNLPQIVVNAAGSSFILVNKLVAQPCGLLVTRLCRASAVARRSVSSRQTGGNTAICLRILD